MTPITGTADTGLEHVYTVHFYENAGTPAAARVSIKDGAGGASLAEFPVPADGSVTHSFPAPLFFYQSCYVEVLSGSVAGFVKGTD